VIGRPVSSVSQSLMGREVKPVIDRPGGQVGVADDWPSHQYSWEWRGPSSKERDARQTKTDFITPHPIKN
jgi:hypothetical protein